MSETSHTDFTPPEPKELAHLLPSYEVHYLIAKGGMGAVYRATQISLQRDVAIKILPRNFGADRSFRESFEIEAKSMAKLKHPNLIAIYDFGQIDDLLYIIMEVVNGKSLYHSAYKKKIDPVEAAKIVIGICRGLENAHEHGILHRDIKPANILLTQDRQAKIGDFGLARPLGDEENALAFGTPGYAAPEIVRNPYAVDESTDLFAVGVILYELISGHLPEKVYSPLSKEADCDPKFDNIVKKATHPTPKLRYRKASSLAEDLEALISEKPLPNSLSNSTAKQLLTSPAKSSSSKPALLKKNTSAEETGKKLKTVSTKSELKSATTANKLKAAAVDSSKSSSKPKLNTSENTETDSSSSGSSSASAAASAAAVAASTTKNYESVIIRNVIIIFALLGAILVAWQGLKVVREKRDAKQARQDQIKQEQEDKRKAEAIRKEEERQARRNSMNNRRRPDIPTDIDTDTSTIETLSGLKLSLKSGKRNIFPKGTKVDGNRARYFVSMPMSWYDAQAHAEEHGGHLAVFEDMPKLDKFTQSMSTSGSIWIGAGTCGDRRWCWVDGTPWSLDVRKTAKLSFVSVDETAILTPRSPIEKLPFYIEWTMDGSNAASLESQISRSSYSEKIFPAGTISYDNRYYLIMDRPMSWESAHQLAEKAGATLAVPSDNNESEWLSNFVKDILGSRDKAWIGGIQQSANTWTWVTGEPWSFANWGSNQPDLSPNSKLACSIDSDGKWDDLYITSNADAFILEWSGKKAEITPDASDTVNVEPNAADQLSKLRSKCMDLVSKEKQKHQKSIHTNFKIFEQQVGSYKRSLSNEVRARYEPGINRLLEVQNDNRLPRTFSDRNMPTKLREILDDCVEREDRIDKAYFESAEKLRTLYQGKLSELAAKLKETGLNAQKRLVDRELEKTRGSIKSFISSFDNS